MLLMLCSSPPLSCSVVLFEFGHVKRYHEKEFGRTMLRRAVAGGRCSFLATSAARFQSNGSNKIQHPADEGGAKPTEESLRGRLQPVRAAEDHQSQQRAAAGYNPWEVLGLKPGVTPHDIRLRYHDLLKSCHPDMAPEGQSDLGKLNQINKAYEIITKSPTLDKRYRNLVTDTQYFYYKFLPEWMAKNVDEMPRYWSWMKWRSPGPVVVIIWLTGAYTVGRMYYAYPFFTIVAVLSIGVDILLHTMIAPATFSMLFMNALLTSQTYNMAWLTSPKGFLRRELGY